jgi:hypothetical protein
MVRRVAGRTGPKQMVIFTIPFVAGIGTAIALWGEHAPRIFFATAAEVIALGAVAMALEGRLFRVSGSASSGGSSSGSGGGIARASRGGVARATILISVGVGLAFAFGALAREDGGGDAHLALTAGALAMGVAGFALEAIFGLGDDAD